MSRPAANPVPERNGWRQALWARLALRFGIISALAVILVTIGFIAYIEYVDRSQLAEHGPQIDAVFAEFDARMAELGVEPDAPIVGEVIVFGVLLALVSATMAILGATWMARKIAEPISEVARSARQLVDGDLGARAEIVPDRIEGEEICRLVRDFNQLAGSLQAAEKRVRADTAAIAHELRTPLTVLSFKTRGMIDGVLETSPQQLATVLDQTDLLLRIVDDLRTISLAEAGCLYVDRSPVNVRNALSKAVSIHGEPLRAAAIEATVEAPDVDFPVDPIRLQQALGNLIANVIRYAWSGARLDIIAEHGPDGLHVLVADRGPGVPSDFASIALRPLTRVDLSRSRDGGGSGLGLSVVAAIASAHGGAVELRNREGGGLEVRLFFPGCV
jgi:two-component system sensor histidine kinase AdeS